MSFAFFSPRHGSSNLAVNVLGPRSRRPLASSNPFFGFVIVVMVCSCDELCLFLGLFLCFFRRSSKKIFQNFFFSLRGCTLRVFPVESPLFMEESIRIAPIVLSLEDPDDAYPVHSLDRYFPTQIRLSRYSSPVERP